MIEFLTMSSSLSFTFIVYSNLTRRSSFLNKVSTSLLTRSASFFVLASSLSTLFLSCLISVSFNDYIIEYSYNVIEPFVDVIEGN
jgi:hypothetical protein